MLENFAPGAAARMGLGAEELRAANPRLIYCSLSGYGQDGPYRDVKAYDALIQGEAGLIMTTGFEDRPARVGVSVTDLISSMYAAVGILTALYQREQTGEGQVIDISMFETAASWLGYFPHHYWHHGEEPKRYGLRHQYITPYGHYLASDGKYFGVAVASPADWEIFCNGVIERPDLLHRSALQGHALAPREPRGAGCDSDRDLPPAPVKRMAGAAGQGAPAAWHA